jgi:hypothetical protein
MPAMLRIFAIRAVGQNQRVAGFIQRPGYGLLNLPRRQRRLAWFIVEVRHFTFRPQSLQDPAELWRAIRVHCSAKVTMRQWNSGCVKM